MARQIKPLEQDKKSSLLLKSFDTRELLVLIFSISSTVLAFIDPNFRATYNDFLILVIGGYLGQLRPR